MIINYGAKVDQYLTMYYLCDFLLSGSRTRIKARVLPGVRRRQMHVFKVILCAFVQSYDIASEALNNFKQIYNMY